MTWVFAALLTWIVLWVINIQLAKIEANRFINLLVPALFGFSIFILWEGFVRGFNISPILLPPPSAIAVRFSGSMSILWEDFVQTFIKGALSGYVIGCSAAFITAVAVDKSNFLKRGLLPVGNFVAALPIIGMAPILVMWFGFDWHSKADVVGVMVFFPMLVNTVAGLNAKDNIQHDLMKTYGASYWQNLLKLNLPAAMPFIFNALKICTTLALIGAIVSEFFGSPTRGMGFRISTEVGRLSLDMVWAEITVAAFAGSAFYGLMALIEKGVTFWHPSQRK